MFHKSQLLNLKWSNEHSTETRKWSKEHSTEIEKLTIKQNSSIVYCPFSHNLSAIFVKASDILLRADTKLSLKSFLWSLSNWQFVVSSSSREVIMLAFFSRTSINLSLKFLSWHSSVDTFLLLHPFWDVHSFHETGFACCSFKVAATF